MVFSEGVAAARCLHHLTSHNIEWQVKAPIEFILPLFDKAAGAANQTAVQVTVDQQFFEQKPGHDGLAGAWVVGEEKAQRLAREHLAVDRGDLMGEGVYQRSMNREQRVEQ